MIFSSKHFTLKGAKMLHRALLPTYANGKDLANVDIATCERKQKNEIKCQFDPRSGQVPTEKPLEGD